MTGVLVVSERQSGLSVTGDVFTAAPTSVDAFRLLEESESLWVRDPLGSVRYDGSTRARHRQALVGQALLAYDRLRASRVPEANPLSVFQRWPACTIVSLLAIGSEHTFVESADWLAFFLGVRDGHDDSVRWLTGWDACLRELVPEGVLSLVIHDDTRSIPGLAVVLARSAVARSAASAPRLHLDVESGGVGVTLPFGRIACTSPSQVAHWIAGVEPGEGLLAFTVDGDAIPPGQPLPAGELWLLRAGGLANGEFQDGLRILEEVPVPPGWTGWRLVRADLSSTTGVLVPNSDMQLEWRSVVGAGRIQVKRAAPIPGLFTLEGEEVDSALPVVLIPETGMPWGVEVRACLTGKVLLLTGAAAEEVALADHLPSPAFGPYEIRVNVASHRAVDHRIFVAEAVEVRSQLAVRVIDSRGVLATSKIDVEVPPRMRAMPSRFHLAHIDAGCVVKLIADNGASEWRVRVELPHMALRKRVGGKNQQWRLGRLGVAFEELAEGVSLDVRIPEEVRNACGGTPALVAEVVDQEVVLQTVAGQRVGGTDVHRYPLAKLIDTVTTNGSLVIRLDLPLPAGRPHMVTVSAPVPATGVRRVGNELHLVDRHRTQELGVVVRAVFAPWEPPMRVRLQQGEDVLVLDTAFIRGPLTVIVGPAELDLLAHGTSGSRLPATCAVFRVGAVDESPIVSGWRMQETVDHLVSGSVPLPGTTHLDRVWDLAGSISARVAEIDIAEVGDRCATALGTFPSAALLALSRTSATVPDLIATLAGSGIAARSLRGVPEPERIEQLWHTVPLSALMLTSPLLPYLAESARWDTAELDDAEAGLLEVAARRLSPIALELLTARRTSPEWAREVVDPFAPERTDLGFAAVSNVHQDIGEHLVELSKFAVASNFHTAFQLVHHRRAAQALGSADQGDAAAFSLSAAFVARIAAQGDPDATRLERELRLTWTAVAREAPDAVAADLALAEVVVSGHPAVSPR